MADAGALFKRHYPEFIKQVGGPMTQCENLNELAIMANLYGACIVAEAILNSLED